MGEPGTCPEKRADGAPAIKRLRGRAVPRSVTVPPELDARVVARMTEDGLSYSGVVEEALRILLGKDKDQEKRAG